MGCRPAGSENGAGNTRQCSRTEVQSCRWNRHNRPAQLRIHQFRDRNQLVYRSERCRTRQPRAAGIMKLRGGLELRPGQLYDGTVRLAASLGPRTCWQLGNGKDRRFLRRKIDRVGRRILARDEFYGREGQGDQTSCRPQTSRRDRSRRLLQPRRDRSRRHRSCPPFLRQDHRRKCRSAWKRAIRRAPARRSPAENRFDRSSARAWHAAAASRINVIAPYAFQQFRMAASWFPHNSGSPVGQVIIGQPGGTVRVPSLERGRRLHRSCCPFLAALGGHLAIA